MAAACSPAAAPPRGEAAGRSGCGKDKAAGAERPKSSNPWYDKAFRIWQSAPHGTVTTQTTYTGVGFAKGQKGPGGEPLSQGFLETTRKTITEESELLWAYSSSGLDERLVSRPKTSNPSYSACSTPQCSRRSSYRTPPGTARPGCAASDASGAAQPAELLWAEHSPQPGCSGSIPIARPPTANPVLDSLMTDDAELHTEQPTGSAVLWSADGSVSAERPKTFNAQLAAQGRRLLPHHADLALGTEVLWSSEGGVSPDLVARPHAPNYQLDPACASPGSGEGDGDDRGPADGLLWAAEEGGPSRSPHRGSRSPLRAAERGSPPRGPAQRPLTANPHLASFLASPPAAASRPQHSDAEVLWRRGELSADSPPRDPAGVRPTVLGGGAWHPAAEDPCGTPPADLRRLIGSQSQLIKEQGTRIRILEARLAALSGRPRPLREWQGPAEPAACSTPPAACGAAPAASPTPAPAPVRPGTAPAQRPPQSAAPQGRLRELPAGSALRVGRASRRSICTEPPPASEQEMRAVFDQLAEPSGRVPRGTFCRWYHSLEHFGGPTNAASVLGSVVGGAGSLGYEEFCIVMLRLAKR